MKIRQIEFIHAITIPGSDVLSAPTISPAKHPGVKMTIVGQVVMIESRGFTGIVPLSNVRSAVLEAEEPKAKK